MVMSYAVGLPTVGGFGDVHSLVDLAVAAEQYGWDGVHLWDHVLYHESGWPVASPVVPLRRLQRAPVASGSSSPSHCRGARSRTSLKMRRASMPCRGDASPCLRPSGRWIASTPTLGSI